MEKLDYIEVIDCVEGLKQLPAESVQCCVTSPPYFRLRDYGMEGQYGMEDTPELYIHQMLQVFMEVHRVLKPDGTLWLNLGDSYWGSGKAGSNPAYQQRHKEFGKPSTKPSRFGKPTTGKHPHLKPKDLIGIPWSVALALRNAGWWLRQDIIWAKKNCMPESITDRCTRTHEYIFMFSKSPTYYYDAASIKTELKSSSIVREQYGRNENKYSGGVPGTRPQSAHKPVPKKQDGHGPRHSGFNERWNKAVTGGTATPKANRRSVWEISTRGLKDEHFAAYPLELPQICIKAGSRPGDIILDPFMGAGTTALAAASIGRHYIGFELNPAYVAIAGRRLKRSLGLFYPENDK